MGKNESQQKITAEITQQKKHKVKISQLELSPVIMSSNLKSNNSTWALS